MPILKITENLVLVALQANSIALEEFYVKLPSKNVQR